MKEFITHVAINVKDMDATLKFYKMLLDLKKFLR